MPNKKITKRALFRKKSSGKKELLMPKVQSKAEINKKMTFSEILEKHPEAVEILMNKGMHCCGCPMAQMESLEDGCKAHGINPDEVVKEINEKVK